jgi:hypothetical protein
MKTHILLFLLFIVATCSLSAQENSKSSIKVGLGLGISMSDFDNGIGYVTELGYQKEIWKDRLRINPNINFGRYNGGLTREKNQQFNSISGALNFNIDAIKYKSVSLLVGCGAFVNNTRGRYISYFRYSPVTPSDSSPIAHIKSFNRYYFGTSISAGFRINPKFSCMAINILPYNLYIGSSFNKRDQYLFNVVPSIQLDFKF